MSTVTALKEQQPRDLTDGGNRAQILLDRQVCTLRITRAATVIKTK